MLHFLEDMVLLKRLVPALVVFSTIIMLGTAGYRWIESWPLTDCLYMAVITISTVGFGEVYPLSREGEVFTIVLIILGVGAITYAISSLTDILVAGEVQGFLRIRRMKHLIDKLSGHYVVCGYGEMGRQICRELAHRGCTMVVVDIDPRAVQQATQNGILALEGDAGLDSVLLECGIARAAGLVVATDDDATNLLVVLTARGLNTDFPIIARANLEQVVVKLLRAGANRALFPQSLAGRRMVEMLLRPDLPE
ncbi:MAG: potassium channel family protein [Acidobacteriota bacterium]